ncbi:MAG TPA: hypothetical protein VJ836_02555 [Candidatus Saccharimonadales bacterium]|nr:hypothetical protein [Candidatus Saccharimonadales bacterium]
MFGLTKKLTTDKLPIFVHAIESVETFLLAQKVWQANTRAMRVDPANRKELLHFTFPRPACTVWLLRDQGRDDCFELIMMWQDKEHLSEVYVIAPSHARRVGDDSRAKQLLNAILSSPSTVPSTSN